MSALKHNIAVMRETKQVPSFVQVLFTFDEAAAHIKALEDALRSLHDACLDVPDFRPDCQVMRQARAALDRKT